MRPFAVVHETVLVAVLAVHDHPAARAADGVGADTLFKQHALLLQPFDCLAK